MHFSLEKDDISFSLPTHLSVQQVEEDEDAEEEDKVGLVVEFRPQTISKALRLRKWDQNSLWLLELIVWVDDIKGKRKIPVEVFIWSGRKKIYKPKRIVLAILSL